MISPPWAFGFSASRAFGRSSVAAPDTDASYASGIALAAAVAYGGLGAAHQGYS
ncbi:hypothetical protein [Streptomyces achromogenes]|uniref:hypothetical protein n=1 Tax=Streptomyces achromogenes TaxID=67255 RepID=UPI0036904ED8